MRDAWFKASKCSGGSCIEVRFPAAGHVEVRDGKLGEESRVLVVPADDWRLFLAEIAAGESAPSGNFIRAYHDGPLWILDDVAVDDAWLGFTDSEWKAFVAAAGDGEFDLP